MLDYTYKAAWTDGTTFEQPSSDESRILPGQKSATYDFLLVGTGKKLDSVELHGKGHRLSLDFKTGRFTIDGIMCEPGDDLSSFGGFVEWVEGDPAQGVYFRRVTKTLNTEFQEISTQVQYCFGVKHEPGVKNFLGVV